MKNWLNELRNAKKHVSEYDSIRTVKYIFKDGGQLEEEYDLKLNVVCRRAWKIKGQICKEWDVELGELEVAYEDLNSIVIKENSSQPYIRKRNTRRIIEWKIRNLPYPSETYSVTSNEEEKTITVRTTNKKYFKTLTIPELDRLGLTPKQKNISFKYDMKALVIKYQKPTELIDFDKAVLKMVRELPLEEDGFAENMSEDDPPSIKKKIVELDEFDVNKADLDASGCKRIKIAEM